MQAAARTASLRRRLGVVPAWGLLAGHLDLELARALYAGDDADGVAGFLEAGRLLDMAFDEGAHRRGQGPFAGRSDGGEQRAQFLQFVAQPHTRLVTDIQHRVERRRVRIDARAHHARHEAPALLIGPVDDLDRRARP